jgi:hypothetical protein
MIRNLQVLVLTALMHSVVVGAVKENISTRVYFRDSNTPLELADPNVPWVYRDIMVGTRLTIIVDSNASGSWSGGLLIQRPELDYGDLYCRGTDCEDSILPDAGDMASVNRDEEDPLAGYFLWAGSDAVAGHWFIIDYNAISAGNCKVGLYDDDWDTDPWYEMSFTHVLSRDLNEDGIVNFTDFAFFGLYWGITDCTDPNGCGKVDFNGDETIDVSDLGLFVKYWLERTN